MDGKKFSGIFLFLTALLLFSISDATAKYLSVSFAIPLLIWVRYFVQFAVMLAAVAPKMGRGILYTNRPWMMLARGFMQVASTLFTLLAFRTMPLADTTALIFIAPILVALLAGPVLGEKIRRRNWLATAIGFVGVLLIARPNGELNGIGVVFALCAALTYSLYQIMTRQLAATEPPLRQLFYISLVGVIVTSFLAPFFWSGFSPAPSQALLIISLGFYGGMGHFLFIRAFHESPASRLAPLVYIQMIWAMLLGWLVFGHVPDHMSVLGMAVIGGAGLILAFGRKAGA